MLEYKVVDLPHFNKKQEETLNALAARGWELVAVVYRYVTQDSYAYLRREKPPAQQ